MSLCMCGCGREANHGNWCNGHWNKGKNHPLYGKHHSEEAKRKNSKSHLGKHFSPATEFKRGHPGRFGKDNPMFGKSSPFRGRYHTEETKQKLREAQLGKTSWCKGKHVWGEEDKIRIGLYHKGKHISEEHKEILRKVHTGNKYRLGTPQSESARKKMRESHNHLPRLHSGYGNRLYYLSPLQGTVCFRSTYELKYAQYLDSKNIVWYYEIETFDVGAETYTPDFYIPSTEKFIEIKGYLYSKSKRKIELFHEQYPWNLEVLYQEDLKKLGIDIK